MPHLSRTVCAWGDPGFLVFPFGKRRHLERGGHVDCPRHFRVRSSSRLETPLSRIGQKLELDMQSSHYWRLKRWECPHYTLFIYNTTLFPSSIATPSLYSTILYHTIFISIFPAVGIFATPIIRRTILVLLHEARYKHVRIQAWNCDLYPDLIYTQDVAI
jgi:hypothetical protein